MLILDEHVSSRRKINILYKELLKETPGITFLENPNKDFESNMWLTCIIVDPKLAGFTREDLRLKMESENIETRPLWKPMHLQPVFEGCPFYGDGTSERLFEMGLCLPSSPILSETDILRIIEVVKGM